jgi:hypothetical protein
MPAKKGSRRELAKREREALSDSYIIKLLTKVIDNKRLQIKTDLKASDIRTYPELIECKRIQIKINRLIRAYKNEKY